jgi:hypothetical protein
MGALLETLRKYVLDRRKMENIAARSQLDHPERRPPDQLPRSSTASAGTQVGVTVIDTEQAVGVDGRTTTASEAPSRLSVPLVQQTTTMGLSGAIRCSDFYLACRRNDICTVRELLMNITLDEVDRLEPNGSTALHSASFHGHEEIVKLLLECGADRSQRNLYGNLPYDEAKTDQIRQLFFRVPSANRFVSATGAIEWESITDDALENAEQDRQLIKSIFDNTTGTTSIEKMFQKIYENYVRKGLANLRGIKQIERFVRIANEQLDPAWIIKAYTAETEFYRVLNMEIAMGTTQFQHERQYLIALLCHHPKLEPLTFLGCSYRIIQVNQTDLQKYQVGASLMTKSFLSSSIDRNLAEILLYQQERAHKDIQPTIRTRVGETFVKAWVMCIYHIKHRRTALKIDNISHYVTEGEVLIMPYSVFQVKRITHIAPLRMVEDRTITEIELEECEEYFHAEV